MKPIQINVDLDAVDPNGVFQDQTGSDAGDMTLNGAGVVSGEWITPDGFAKQIALESAGNISSVVFTIVGFADVSRNLALSETVTGISGSAVETSNYFYVITSITRSATIGTNVEAGPVDEAVTAIQPTNWRSDNISLLTTVTGTVNYTVQQTFDDIQDTNQHPLTWSSIEDSNFVTATAGQVGNLQTIPRAMRLVINSYSSGAAVEFNIIHADR